MDFEHQYPLTAKALTLLSTAGISLDRDAFLARIAEFHRLCSTWNLAAKLMSKGDLGAPFDGHVADSLSLVPYIHQLPDHRYVDIGSGGGFPALPIALALPTRPVVLLERSQVKVDFLRQVPRAIAGLNVEIAMGQYPDSFKRTGPTIYTARAIEKPEVFDAALLGRLGPGDVYLMQREPSEGVRPSGIKAVRTEDAFTRDGLRRGVLYRVQR